MKKIVLFLSLILSVTLGFAQNTPLGCQINNAASDGSLFAGAPCTVDQPSWVNKRQTTAGRKFTIPNYPSATAGRVLDILNDSISGSVAFTLVPGGVLEPNERITLRWQGTRWTVEGKWKNLPAFNALGDITLQNGAKIKSGLASNNYLYLNGSGMGLSGGNSDVEITSAQDVIIGAQSAVKIELLKGNYQYGSLIGENDLFSTDGVEMYSINTNTFQNTRVFVDTTLVKISADNPVTGNGKRIVVDSTKIFISGNADAEIITLKDDSIKIGVSKITISENTTLNTQGNSLTIAKSDLTGSTLVMNNSTMTVGLGSYFGNLNYLNFTDPNLTYTNNQTSGSFILNLTGSGGIFKFKTGVGSFYASLSSQSLTADRFFNYPDRAGTLATTNDMNFTLSTASNIVDINTKGLIFKDGAVTKWHVADNVFYDNSNVESADMINRYLKNTSGSIIVNYSSATNGLGISNVGSANFVRLKNTNVPSTITLEFPVSSGTFALTSDINTAVSGTAGRAAYFTGTNTVGSSANYLWDNSNNILSVNGIFKTPSTGTGYYLYNTVNESTDYERLAIYKSANTFILESQNLGTGNIRNVQIGTLNRKLAFLESAAISGIYQFQGATGSANATIVNTNGTMSASSGTNAIYAVTNQFNHTSTAGFRLFWGSPFLSTVGSGPQLFFDMGFNTAANGAGTHTTRYLMDVNGTMMIGGGSLSDLATAKLSTYTTSLINQRWAYDASNKCEVTVSSLGFAGFTLTGTNPEFSFNNFVRLVGGFSSATSLQNSNLGIPGASAGQGAGQTANNSNVLFSSASAVSYRAIYRGATQTTIPVGEGYGGVIFGSDGYTEAASGNHPMAARVVIKPVGITNGAAVTDTTTALLITGASTVGTQNYALFVASGISNFSGNVLLSGGNRTISGSNAITLQSASGSDLVFNTGGANTRMTISSTGGISIIDGNTIGFGTGTGTKLGTSTSQKLAFWNATPIVQPTTGIAGATYVSGGGATVTRTDTFGGYTIEQMAAIIKTLGLAQ